MGSGKTTLGLAFSKKMGMPFVDMDNFIEARYHASVKDLFKIHGESGFREIERKILHEIADFEDVVIACGGGTPCFFDNMDYMNSHGLTVYLKPPIECFMRRLTIPSAKAKRPLIANKSNDEIKSFVENAIEQRKEYYEKAMLIFDSDKLESIKEVKQSVDDLEELIRKA